VLLSSSARLRSYPSPPPGVVFPRTPPFTPVRLPPKFSRAGADVPRLSSYEESLFPFPPYDCISRVASVDTLRETLEFRPLCFMPPSWLCRDLSFSRSLGGDPAFQFQVSPSRQVPSSLARVGRGPPCPVLGIRRVRLSRCGRGLRPIMVSFFFFSARFRSSLSFTSPLFLFIARANRAFVLFKFLFRPAAVFRREPAPLFCSRTRFFSRPTSPSSLAPSRRTCAKRRFGLTSKTSLPSTSRLWTIQKFQAGSPLGI